MRSASACSLPPPRSVNRDHHGTTAPKRRHTADLWLPTAVEDGNVPCIEQRDSPNEGRTGEREGFSTVGDHDGGVGARVCDGRGFLKSNQVELGWLLDALSIDEEASEPPEINASHSCDAPTRSINGYNLTSRVSDIYNDLRT